MRDFRKMTLVSAPAGFGKTTLLSAWIHEKKLPVAWISLDEGDNDPARFLSYLIAALQTIQANVGQVTRTMLQSPQPPPMESVLAMLINEIATAWEDASLLPRACPERSEGAGFALVLDDYQLISAQPVHDAVTFLLDHLPPQMHLVILTRADPPLALARLRAHNQLTEIRADHLRFTPDEATVFLNQVMGLALSAEDIAAVELLKRLHTRLQFDGLVIFLGDSEFDGVKVQRQLDSQDWYYVCRTSPSLYVYPDGEVGFPLSDLVPRQGAPERQLDAVEFTTKHRYGPVSCFACWEAPHDEPLSLVYRLPFGWLPRPTYEP